MKKSWTYSKSSIITLWLGVPLACLLVMGLFRAKIFDGIFRQVEEKNLESAQGTATGPIRGTSGDLWADTVIGKDNFGEGEPGEIVPFKVFNPGGVAVDRTSTPNRVYVYDGSNSRILGYKSLGVCQDNPSVACSSDSDCANSSCQIRVGGQQGTKTPDIVLGQPDLYHTACNGDFNYQNYPSRAPASASSLCSMPESQVSTTEGGSFASMAVDAAGNLYVGDFDNHRVLKYYNPFALGTTSASEVWGQSDFSGNSCNQGKGVGNATASTLCFRSPFNEGFGTGIDFDANGNMWVTDNQNNRVLRFPNAGGVIAKTADLVLGQSGFISGTAGSSMSQMHAPVAVKVSPTTGEVYVADELNNRILVFQGPFTNGMAAQRTFASNLRAPEGLEFDPLGQGIWVNDMYNSQLVLFDFDGNPIKVLFKDTYQPNGQCGSVNTVSCINPQTDPVTHAPVCWANLCMSRGGFGIDRDGNVLVSATSFAQDLWRYKSPIPTPQSGKTYSADTRFFYPPGGANYLSGNKGFESPRGIVVAAGQLIVADAYKIKFWNAPNGLADLTNGKPADGVVGVPSFASDDPWGFFSITAQSDQYLWVGHQGYVEVYQLPLTSGAMPIKRAISLYDAGLPVLGGGVIVNQWGTNEHWGDLTIDPDGSSLWLSQPFYHRVFRVRNPFTSPQVDVVLGQENISSTVCNQGDSRYPPQPGDSTNYPLNYLCYPGGLTFDRQGNLFISDHWLEVAGNFRLLTYGVSSLPQAQSTAVYNIAATHAIPNVATWKPAFDSQNHMVVGYNGYSNKRFPGVYLHPLTQTTPDMYLNDYFSMPVFSLFDNADNLYVDDLNRGRLLVYAQPLLGLLSPTEAPNQSPTPLATTPTRTPTRGPSQSPTRTPTKTPTRTPTRTPTPTRVTDTSSPLVRVTSPTNGGTVVSGRNQRVDASATDNVKVSKMEVYVNNSLLCTAKKNAIGCMWRVPNIRNISYQIIVKAYDTSNNIGTAVVSVTSR